MIRNLTAWLLAGGGVWLIVWLYARAIDRGF